MDHKDLPIAVYEQEIVETIRTNPVTIIVAETGAGKSTQVPQYLLKVGYRIVVTEPRRLAARSLAARVAFECGRDLGGVIGYRTGFERFDSPGTECLFTTDGLELVREIHTDWQPQVLIIDEVHEWNLNIETLIAWSKKRLGQDPNFKVVIMSATLEADKLSQYFDNASVIEVAGRLFTVEERLPRFGSLVTEVANLVKQGHNVLVFQPGKREISETVETLNDMEVGAEVLPLHGDMEPEEQDRVFQSFKLSKVVVATNIAQTSVTIDDITAVVDSGLERRVETQDGIEGLYLRRTAKADDEQRKGRAGRCQPGIYLNYYDGLEEQLDFPTAEIQRVRLDQLVLRLAIQGFDALKLDFFHQPNRRTLQEAKRMLFALGAVNDKDEVTAIGREMALLPVSVKYARMVVEAKRLQVLDDVLTIAACLEVSGINSRRKDDTALWRRLSAEPNSDLLVQLDLFNKAREMKGSDELRENGIHPKSFFKALEIRKKLSEALIFSASRRKERVMFDSCGERDKILRACLTGMVDHLYRLGFRGRCYNSDGTSRMLDLKSVVLSWAIGWLVGLPKDIEAKDRWGCKKVYNLVTMASAVRPELLATIAPHLVQLKRANWRLTKDKKVTFNEVVIFNSTELPESEAIEVSWEELGRLVPSTEELEKIRQEVIDAQFSAEKRYAGCLESRVVVPREVNLNNVRPKNYGYDPATGEPLIAYPAIVKMTYGAWEIAYFPTSVEAHERQQEFNREFLSTKSVITPELAVALAGAANEVAAGKWQDLGKRWWRCPRGHSTRAAKKATTVTCEICGLAQDLPEEK